MTIDFQSAYPDVYTQDQIRNWTRMWIIRPDRQLGTLLDDFSSADFDLVAFENGNAVVRMHKDCRACLLEYQGVTALADEFENWGLNLYYRDPGDGTKKRFMGIRGPTDKSWKNNQQSSFITVTFVAMFRELTRRRQVWSVNGLREEITGTPDDIARELCRRNMQTGTVITPTGGTGTPQDRTRFGPSTDTWAVTVEADSASHPDSFTYRLDHGTNLSEALNELFVGEVPSTGNPTDIWPTITETSPKNFLIGFLHDRSGAGRNVGSDQSGRHVSPETRTLEGYRKQVDTEARANSFEMRGSAIGISTYRFYIGDSTAQAKSGTIEDSWQLPNADNVDELEWEARLFLRDRKDGLETFTADIREAPGFIYGVDFQEGDTITLYSGKDSFDETVVKDILGVKITIPAPGFPKLSAILGKFQRNPLSDRARHGGGGGRAGGGGRPNSKTGNFAQSAYVEIAVQSGGPVIADRVQGPRHYLRYRGLETSTFLRVETSGTDVAASTTAGSPDDIWDEVHADYFDTDPTPDGMIVVKIAGGGSVWIPAQFIPGGGGP